MNQEYVYNPTSVLKLFITNGCNNACKGCFNSSTYGALKSCNLLELDLKEILSIISQANDRGMNMIEFSGGEPTLRFQDLCVALKHCSKLGIESRLITNGGLIGAECNYQNYLRPYLKREGIEKFSPTERVGLLKKSGLTSVIVSVDSEHTMYDIDWDMNGYPIKVPISIVGNTIKSFLSNGYGESPSDTEETYFNKRSLRISVTASGCSYKPSFDLIEDLVSLLQAKKIENDGKYKVYQVDKQLIYLHRNNIADIGMAQNFTDEELNLVGDRMWALDCPHLKARSQSIEGHIHQDMTVNYDGFVHTCAMQAFPIGNIRESSFEEIIDYVNCGDIPSEFRDSVLVFREILSVAQQVDGENVIGEVLRRVNIFNPKLVEKIRTHGGACYAIGHDPKFLEALRKYNRKHQG